MQDRVSRFTVEIGPMPRDLFNRFLPNPETSITTITKESHSKETNYGEPNPASEDIDQADQPLLNQVRELIDAYLRDPLDYQVKVILEPDTNEVPVLGSIHARMGMGVWLGARPLGEIACRL